MNRLEVVQATSAKQASEWVTKGDVSLAVLKAGGMDVVDHLKEGLMAPDRLVNLKTIEDKMLRIIASEYIGTMVTLAELGNSMIVGQQAPVIAQAAGDAATPQVRNVATVGGNLLQRPRCWYYRHEQFHCLKKGGTECFAVDGENRYHAIFGFGPCYIVHPSNLAPALYVCDGVVHVTGGDRETIPIRELYHEPQRDVTSEHNLEAGEVITHITFTSAPTSAMYVVKEKQSFDWPAALACVSLELDGDVILSASVCAGAVAPVPHPLDDVARALAGVNVNNDAQLRKVCELSTRGARPLSGNEFKLKLLPVVLRRAILKAAGRKVEA